MKRRGLGGGAIALVVAVVSWGGLFPAGKLVLAALDPYYLSTIRYGIAASLFVLILGATDGPSALRLNGRGRELALFGALGFAGFSLFSFEGLRFTTPQQAAVIAATQPIVITAYQRIAHGTRLSAVSFGCILSALAGCIVVVTRGRIESLTQGGSAFGDLLVFVGSVCWIGYTFGAARFAEWSPVRYTALSCVFGTFAIFFFTLLATLAGRAHVPAAADVQRVAVPMGFLILMASVLAVMLWNFGVKKLGPLNASLFGNFVPVVTFVIAAVQGQPVAAMEVIGATLVLGSLVVNNLHLRRALPAGMV